MFVLNLSIVGNYKLAFDINDINELSKEYSILMGYLLGRIKILEVKVGQIIGSEFFNRGVLSKMDENKMEFVIAANYNKRIKEILEHHKNQTQNISTYPPQISYESVLFLSTCDYSKYEIWIFIFLCLLKYVLYFIT
jgi:hypothetical protein